MLKFGFAQPRIATPLLIAPRAAVKLVGGFGVVLQSPPVIATVLAVQGVAPATTRLTLRVPEVVRTLSTPPPE